MRDALNAGYVAASRAAIMANTSTKMSVPYGMVIPSITLFGTAYDSDNPNASPRATPIRAPNNVTITASPRTARRILRRPIPTARSRPISRVRSKTDNANVIAMPRKEKAIATVNSMVTRNSNVSI